MVLNICKVNGKAIDYKLSNYKKDESDFNKSLVRAGFTFWQPCQVDCFMVASEEEAKNILSKYPLNENRVFDSVESMTVTKNICYCSDCGHAVISADKYCSICGNRVRR